MAVSPFWQYDAQPAQNRQSSARGSTLTSKDAAGANRYLTTTRTTNEPGLTLRVGRFDGSLAGVSMYSAADRNTFLVFGSKASVLALCSVFTAPASSYASADFSWKMFSVPSPHEKTITFASGSNAAKSTPPPVGASAM